MSPPTLPDTNNRKVCHARVGRELEMRMMMMMTPPPRRSPQPWLVPLGNWNGFAKASKCWLNCAMRLLSYVNGGGGGGSDTDVKKGEIATTSGGVSTFLSEMTSYYNKYAAKAHDDAAPVLDVASHLLSHLATAGFQVHGRQDPVEFLRKLSLKNPTMTAPMACNVAVHRACAACTSSPTTATSSSLPVVVEVVMVMAVAAELQDTVENHQSIGVARALKSAILSDAAWQAQATINYCTGCRSRMTTARATLVEPSPEFLLIAMYPVTDTVAASAATAAPRPIAVSLVLADDQSSAKYDLTACIVHKGNRTSYLGHHVIYFFAEETTWRCDDEDVRESTFNEFVDELAVPYSSPRALLYRASRVMPTTTS